LDAYNEDRNEFLYKVINDSDFLHSVAKIEFADDLEGIIEFGDDDEDGFGIIDKKWLNNYYNTM